MLVLLPAIVAVVLSASATALAASPGESDPAKGTPGKGQLGKNKDFSGLVDIGGGREMYMECRGKGSPTVVLVSGAGDRAETWSKTRDPAEQALLPAISETNRVCVYDRPGTYLADGEGTGDFLPSRSDPAPQPTTLQDAVNDLHALLGASGERGPYVLVGHSMGGAISKLFASEYPEYVSGLVLIDYTPYEARKALTDRQWGYWKVLLGNPPEEAIDLYPAVERFRHQRNLEQALITAPLKPMPLIVLSSDEPYDLIPYVKDGTLPLTADQAERLGELLFRVIVEARANLVSQVPGARHITETHSGHYIHQEQPRLVLDSVREVVEAARKKSCALGIKNHGQCVKAQKRASSNGSLP
ncbi:MAG TPA: alpha/beta hydrolase [Rubrobacter sp.]|nr:alpha/beta hydrolase [Rubrobacter sp.]